MTIVSVAALEDYDQVAWGNHPSEICPMSADSTALSVNIAQE